jgi:hypothetical protein
VSSSNSANTNLISHCNPQHKTEGKPSGKEAIRKEAERQKKNNPQIAVQYPASHSFVRKPELNWLMDGFLEPWVYKQAF